jgi:pyruvate kinase
MEKRLWNKTKIVATIGPASASRDVLKGMILAGADICRINFSHGSYEDVKKIIDNIRDLNNELQANVGILADLQGPKIRIGEMENGGAELKEGAELVFTTEKCTGSASKVYMTYPQFPGDVAIGDLILIDDGKIHLSVTGTNRENEVKAKVLHGGVLGSKKGVNLPDTKISLPCLTPKDEADLEFALQNGVEWIGLSFVRSVTDIADLKDKIKTSKNGYARVIAKIEKPEAIREIDQIIDLADGVMVARGDLGVEMPMEQVPILQKLIVRKCIEASKPVIIATQMMESMIDSFSPTRAEVNDVANAVMDGADAVMLSGETSVGKWPVRVIQHMQRIIERVEREESIYYREHPPALKNQTYISDTICYNACVTARQANVKAIISMTYSGYTAFKLSSHRPKANIFIFTENRRLLNTLSLIWGVRGFYYDKYESTDNTIADLKEFIFREGYVMKDDLIINIASMPMGDKGRANMMKLSLIGS